MSMTSSIRDWAGLPEHIQDLIVTKFGPLSDYFRFSSVCSQWHNVVNINPSVNILFNILKISGKKFPMLMIKTEDNNDDSRGLYNVLNGTTYNLRLPLAYKYRFIGSSHGWLLYLDKNLTITLLDPVNNYSISLPIFKDDSERFKKECDEDTFDYYIKKATLTANPHINPNYEVVVIYHCKSKLAYYNSDHMSWKFINLAREKHYLMDIICYQGCVYGVAYPNKLLQIDFQNSTAKVVVPASETGGLLNLVESQDGKMLLVERFWYTYYKSDDNSHFYKTFKFKVYKLVYSTEKEFATWEEIDNIGEQALFVGPTNCSVSVSTTECLEFYRNSIYYTPQPYVSVRLAQNKYQGIGEDSGIYSLGDKSIHSHKILGSSEKYVQPPDWFVPNLK